MFYLMPLFQKRFRLHFRWHFQSYTFHCFFRILGSIKIKFVQKIVQLMTNNPNLFLALLWTLETSSRPFNDFDKMVVFCDLLMLSRWCLVFLIVSVHTFKRGKLKRTWMWGPAPNHVKLFISRPSFMSKRFKVQKIYSITCSISCANTYHDVIT